MRDYRIETPKELAKFINDWAKIFQGHDLRMSEADVERLDDERVVFTVRLPNDTSSSLRFDLARPVVDRAVTALTGALAASFEKTGLDLQKFMDDMGAFGDDPETDLRNEN
jgi:hypothetical protein